MSLLRGWSSQWTWATQKHSAHWAWLINARRGGWAEADEQDDQPCVHTETAEAGSWCGDGVNIEPLG